jgi:hypothetical protein
LDDQHTTSSAANWLNVSEQLAQIEDAIQRLTLDVSSLAAMGLERNVAEQVSSAASRCRQALTAVVMESAKVCANADFKSLTETRLDEGDYELKKRLAKKVNETFRRDGAVICHPETKEPCLLLAVGSPDGKGRYVFASRQTRKRSHTSIALIDMLPLTPMPDSPRKESFLERSRSRDSESQANSDSWAQRHHGRDADGPSRR